jgi:hypothetical protein
VPTQFRLGSWVGKKKEKKKKGRRLVGETASASQPAQIGLDSGSSYPSL